MKRYIALFLTAIIITSAFSGCGAVRALKSGEGITGFFSSLKADFTGECDQELDVLPSLEFSSGAYSAVQYKNGYQSLQTADERAAYEAIENGIYSFAREESEDEYGVGKSGNIKIPNITSAQIFKVKEAVINDHPEAFWLNGTYTVGYNMRDGDFVTLYSNYTYEQALAKFGALTVEANLIIDSVPANLSEYERELFIHDKIVNTAEYDVQAVNYPKRNYDAYNICGVLINKKAVCSGYAPVFKLLLGQVGIKSILVNGVSKGQGHVWNAVQIDGRWYQTDITWNDPVTKDSTGMINYNYFNLTDEMMMRDHEYAVDFSELTDELISTQPYAGPDFFNFPLPDCISTNDTYYIRNSLEIKSLDRSAQKELASWLLAAIAGDDDIIYLRFDKSLKISDCTDWLFNGSRASLQLAANEANVLTSSTKQIKSFKNCYYSKLTGESAPLWSNLVIIQIEIE